MYNIFEILRVNSVIFKNFLIQINYWKYSYIFLLGIIVKINFLILIQSI